MEQQTMRQIEDGEFAPHRDEAARMTPQGFAKKHGASIRPWGYPLPAYWCVQVDGVDYLWSIATGQYDGWDYHCQCQHLPVRKLQIPPVIHRVIDTMRFFIDHWQIGGLRWAWQKTQRYWPNAGGHPPGATE